MAPNVQRSSSFVNFTEFSMQQPTCTNTRIRSTADAHKIFSAIQQGILRMVTRRRIPCWIALKILWASAVERMRVFVQVGCCIENSVKLTKELERWTLGAIY